jgi:FkbM family methyltransferase
LQQCNPMLRNAAMDLPVKFVQAYGIFKGISLYLKFKLRITGKLKVPGLPRPVYLRPGTNDEYTFIEIFIRQDYGIDFPAPVSEPVIIVDAGANIGLSSVYFANRFPMATIECFEPDVENFAWLLKNTAGYPNIRLHQAALWGKSGLVSIVNRGVGSRGNITRETGPEDAIPATGVADLMAQNNYPTIFILKLDIEGAEKSLFDHNADGWLPRVQNLVIELHDSISPGSSMSFFRALSAHSFSTTISGENLVVYMHTGATDVNRN